MKKTFITSLALLLMPISVLADDASIFSATDKVLYFNSDVLIDVIKSTFPENLQLDVANKYVDLMDDKGNVSVADLTTVCEAGNLDAQKCRKFIQDLLNTSENKDIKPFYWADYVGKGRVVLGIRNSGDGYFNDHESVDLGGWGIKFDWTTDGIHSSFKKTYPGSNAIIGVSACTPDAGTPYMPDNTKNYAPNTQTGEHCWCKMTGPEESPWVYLLNQTTTNAQSTCARGCSVHCLNAMYGNAEFYSTNMQKAMFTWVRVNKSNASSVIDDTIKSTLVAAVTPPPPPQPAPQPAPKPKPITPAQKPAPVTPTQPKPVAPVSKPKPVTPVSTHKCPFDWAEAAENIGGVREKGYDDPHLDFYTAPSKTPTFTVPYHHTDKSLKTDEWMIQPSFVRTNKFKCRYPTTKYLKGTARVYGGVCECKLTSPENSEWWRGTFGSKDESYMSIETCVYQCASNFASKRYNHVKITLKALGKR